MGERRNRDIYVAIMRAAYRGEGVNLSAEEAGRLAGDAAIETAASNILDESDLGKDWRDINPFKYGSRP